MENARGICLNCNHYVYVGQGYTEQEDSIYHTSKLECEMSIRIGRPREPFGPTILKNKGLQDDPKQV